MGFLALEAVLHVYLLWYLVSIDAAILAIAFTAFELTMFVRLLLNNKKELTRVPCTYHEYCCKEGEENDET